MDLCGISESLRPVWSTKQVLRQPGKLYLDGEKRREKRIGVRIRKRTDRRGHDLHHLSYDGIS